MNIHDKLRMLGFDPLDHDGAIHEALDKLYLAQHLAKSLLRAGLADPAPESVVLGGEEWATWVNLAKEVMR